MIKGKLYKYGAAIIFCIKTDINPDSKWYEGFVIKSDEYSTLGLFSRHWSKEASEEYVGQLSLNNVSLNM